MREVRTRTQAASLVNVFPYENEQQSEWTERQTAAMKPLLIEQAWWGEDSQVTLRWNSEYRLMLAVLQDAVMCWVRCSRTRNMRERRMFQEIYAWFWNRDRSWLYAFESICEYLDLEPDAIRRGLKNGPSLSLQQPDSLLQMRRVRRHKKIRALQEIEE